MAEDHKACNCENMCNRQRNDFLREYHKGLAEEVRKLESNYFQILTPIIAALGVYGYGLKSFFDCECPSLILFLAATIATVILLFVVYITANILGYTHRSNQIILWRIEKNVFNITEEVGSATPDYRIVPSSWNPCKKKETMPKSVDNKKAIDPPDIYRFFKWLSLCASIGVTISTLMILWFNYSFSSPDYCECCVCLDVSQKTIEFNQSTIGCGLLFILVFIAAVCIWLKFRWRYCSNSYSTKLKNFCPPEEEKEAGK